MKPETKPKEQFGDRLRGWVQESLGIGFDKLNHIQQSRQMILFYVQEVLGKLLPGLVPDDADELESCIIDGSGDGGADLLYRTDDGKVLIIQAKYRGKDSSESPESVGRVCDFLHRLYLASLGKQSSLNNALVELSSQIDWAEDVFHVYFITTAKTGEAVRDRIKQGLTSIPEIPDLSDRSELHYLDQTLLNQELREAISSADFSGKPIVIPMLPDSNGIPWCHYEGVDRELYMGEVSGAMLANVLQTHKASLFTMNIRDYVGDSKTNKQIIKTAVASPLNFEYFNNGVTAVAGIISANLTARTLTCEKLSIINGAQTVRSLLTAVKKPGENEYKPVSSVRVLFRLMSFSYPKEVDFVRDVTRYNNTQNSVKISDFRSNDECQKDLSRRFSQINFNGRSYEYKNKRADKKRNSLPISLEEFSKALFAFRFGPDDFWGGTEKMFDASAVGLYTKIFEHPEAPITDSDFALMAGTFFACDQIKVLWESHRKEHRKRGEPLHPSLERKGLVYFVVGELERQSYLLQGLNFDADIKKLAKPNSWKGDPGSSACKSLEKAFQIATKILKQVYEAEQKGLGFKHRNWFRAEQTLESIKGGVTLALDFGTPPRLL